MVETTHTAGHLGSGGVEVLATPVMIALMEDAARTLVDPKLELGQMSVGVNLDVSHLAATPVGMRVTARAEVVAADGRRVTFKVEAHDEQEKNRRRDAHQGHHQSGPFYGPGSGKGPDQPWLT